MNNDDKLEALAIGALVLIAVFAISIFVYLKVDMHLVTGRVTNLTWVRSLNVEVLRQLHDNSLYGFQPSDAYDQTIYIHSWTTWNEECTGSGKSKTCWDEPSDHSETRVSYHVNRWRYDRTLQTSGTPHDERLWPAFTPSTDAVSLGAERKSSRGEVFNVAFKVTDTSSYTYTTTNIQTWRTFSLETSYSFRVNHFNEVAWDTLAPTEEN